MRQLNPAFIATSLVLALASGSAAANTGNGLFNPTPE